MYLVQRVLKVALVVAILAVIGNDTWRYMGATFELTNVTREAATRSVAEIKTAGGDQGLVWKAGETYAQSHGASVYGFEMKEQTVHVWTRMPVKGTWILQRLAATLEGKPADTPLLIEDDTTLVIPST